MIRGLVLAGLVACTTGTKSRVVYREPATGYTIKHNENLANKRGEPGVIHPAVLEHILAAPESPLVAYYDLVLARSDVPAPASADLLALKPVATALASGHRPTGAHYARALARKVIPELNKALAHAPQRSGQRLDGSMISTNPNPSFGGTYEGTAALWWGVPVDLDAGAIRRDYEYKYGETALRTVVYRYASLGLVVLRSSGTERAYIWDVGAVAGAFDPAARLDLDAVARAIVPLHPRQP